MTSYEAKRKNIGKWIHSYINSEFRNLNRYGHLIRRHLNQNPADMMKRSAKEKENISSFYGREQDVLALVHQTLLDNAEEIADWLADDTDRLPWVVYGSFIDDSVTGKIIMYSGKFNWDDGPVDCNEFVVALSKIEHNNAFRIRSCYPIP